MFEELRLFGDTERSIVVETRAGRRIDNLIDAEPGEQERRVFQLILRGFRENFTIRKGPGGGYNCAGHVWASRRTSLFDPASWRQILADDGYRRLAWSVETSDAVQPEDVVLYIDQEKGGILHVARVIASRIASGGIERLTVLSKLNSAQGELIHAIDDVAFLRRHFAVNTEIWTDRSPNHDGTHAALEIPS